MSEKLTPAIPELGHLVDSLPGDESRYFAKPLVDWARANFNKPEIEVTELNSERMLGETSITINGQPARLGWMKIDGNKALNPYHISQRERLTILEGSVTLKNEDKYIKLSAPSEADLTPNTQSAYFGTGSIAYFRNPDGPDEGRCWYLFTPI